MSIAEKIVAWQKKHGRHGLPWQQNITPYRVWVSEIMLQQTQVTTVIPYYQRFMSRFPSLISLANASEDVVIEHWAGLGYYRRARYLHLCSQVVRDQHNGDFPSTADELIALPGIGKSTAHAILSISHNMPCAILDGNVKRVLARYHNISDVLTGVETMRNLWKIAQTAMSQTECRTYTQGIMDLGANICKRQPLCDLCPLQSGCKAYKYNTQGNIPNKPRKKLKRTETCYFRCYMNSNRLWMEQRPSSGIWPKLWSPPYCTTKPCEKTGHVALASFRHTFTHFHMLVHPIIIHTVDPRRNTGGAWFALDQAERMAIPTAVKKIIKAIQHETMVS